MLWGKCTIQLPLVQSHNAGHSDPLLAFVESRVTVQMEIQTSKVKYLTDTKLTL